MTTVVEQIRNANNAICRAIQRYSNDRGLLSQNILSQERNLLEGIIVRLHLGQDDGVYNYSAIKEATNWIKTKNDNSYRVIRRFLPLVQEVSSHYTFDEDTSERLMLHHYEYLLRLRALVKDKTGHEILTNLELFPLKQDSTLSDYQRKIAFEIQKSGQPDSESYGRYYIHKTRPFFVDSQIYYEVTFFPAVNWGDDKGQRIVAFTDIDIVDNYAAVLSFQDTSIELFGKQTPIKLIRNWKVAIRPAEIQNFARLLGQSIGRGRTDSTEYKFVMAELSKGFTLLDFIDATDEQYNRLREKGIAGTTNPQIFPALDKARQIIRGQKPGQNILRYLLLRMRNRYIKSQYNAQENSELSGLNLHYGCIPFDEMPFCSMLREHTTSFLDVISSISLEGRTHELLARHIRYNIEQRGILYTPLSELTAFKDIEALIAVHNKKIYHKHRPARDLVLDKGHVFIQGYEDDTCNIIAKLQSYTAQGVSGYSAAVKQWLENTNPNVDDNKKREDLVKLFEHSRLALIYGAAGTGKTQMISHITNYFSDKKILLLATTNSAVDNLRRRVTTPKSKCETIEKQIAENEESKKDKNPNKEVFDLLIIDECSTVSNQNFLKILNETKFKLLVLVGDVFQIEAIRFGNWFNIARSYLPKESIFELETPFRVEKDSDLDKLWGEVRSVGEKDASRQKDRKKSVSGLLAHGGYSKQLDASLFENHSPESIILALNYDGFYGINNINRFLQASNPNPAITWGASIYKKEDPVLFNDNHRFKGLIYNNLKGTIVDIRKFRGHIEFDIFLNRPITEFDVENYNGIEWIADSTVRFSVYDIDSSDNDEDYSTSKVPFHIAYAVGIHKAQGLEYENVKIVITDDNKEDITHSIFYTAITRARDSLDIYWSPETQQTVLSNFQANTHGKDICILKARKKMK